MGILNLLKSNTKKEATPTLDGFINQAIQFQKGMIRHEPSITETNLALRFMRSENGSLCSPFAGGKGVKIIGSIMEAESDGGFWAFKVQSPYLFSKWVKQMVLLGCELECFLLKYDPDDLKGVRYNDSDCTIEIILQEAQIICHYPFHVFFRKSIIDIENNILDLPNEWVIEWEKAAIVYSNCY